MFTIGMSLESEYLPREKMEVMAYLKGSKRDWDLSKKKKHKLFQCMTKLEFIFI